MTFSRGCPASTISSPRRQLFLPANDNHFLPLRAKRSVRPRTFTFQRWFGAVGMRATCFWFPTFPFALVAGAVEMWESRLLLAGFPSGSWQEGAACFWPSTLSTDAAFPQLSFLPRCLFSPPRLSGSFNCRWPGDLIVADQHGTDRFFVWSH